MRWLVGKHSAPMNEDIPTHLTLQWHITDLCNHQCRHCYQESYQNKDLEFEALQGILEQFRRLCEYCRKHRSHPFRAHINVTGGEPFLRNDFSRLLELMHGYQEEFSFAVLSNGSLLDSSSIRWLEELKPRFIQLSVDGRKATHDMIRGYGDYDSVVRAAKLLVRSRIRCYLSFTAHSENYLEFPYVAALGRRLGVSLVWTDRYVPYGQGKAEGLQSLSPEQTVQYLELIRKAREYRPLFSTKKTLIGQNRALQFITGGKLYNCSAGRTLISIGPQGELYPCRRMPIVCGNVLETPLADLYFGKNPQLQALRNNEKTPRGCEGCFHLKYCQGGLKCLSYALKGSGNHCDPGCPRNLRLQPK